MLVKRAQRQEVKSLVMLKIAAAKVMLRRGVDPSLIDGMLKYGKEKRAFALNLRDSSVLSAIAGMGIGGAAGGLHGLYYPDEDEEGKPKSRMDSVLAHGLGGAALGGIGSVARSLIYNHLAQVGDESEVDLGYASTAGPAPIPITYNEDAATAAGAIMGAGLGGVVGWMNPGYDVKGKRRNRLQALLVAGAGGAALGGIGSKVRGMLYDHLEAPPNAGSIGGAPPIGSNNIR